MKIIPSEAQEQGSAFADSASAHKLTRRGRRRQFMAGMQTTSIARAPTSFSVNCAWARRASAYLLLLLLVLALVIERVDDEIRVARTRGRLA
eukprot:6197291-Pleurochrysis_carterae.AAC.2